MIERKTYKADIDRLRPRLFLMAISGVTITFLVLLNIRWHNPVSSLLDDAFDDVSVDMDLMPSLQPPENVVAALHEIPPTTDKINKVDKTENELKQDELKESLTFKTSEAGDAEQMKASEVEPIAPAITSMNGEELPLRVVEELPEFPGGMSEFVTWLNTALQYPRVAMLKKIQGTVLISFVVEKDGTITNYKYVKKASSSLDREAMRVIRIMPKWKPGKDHGKPCRTVVAVPIVFAL